MTTEETGTVSHLLLVDTEALPEVYVRVVEAKRMLGEGIAENTSEAARMAGISRSAFYKYRDMVFEYDAEGNGKIFTVHAVLRDRPGVLSNVLSAFADAGANILTVNQNIPSSGRASVSISARTGSMKLPADVFLSKLAAIDGVVKASPASYYSDT